MQYWPDGSNVYGCMVVSLHKEEMFADYILRTFVLKKVRQMACMLFIKLAKSYELDPFT